MCTNFEATRWTALSWAASWAKIWLQNESYSASVEVGTASVIAHCWCQYFSGDHGYVVYFSDVNTFWLVSGNKLLQLCDCVHIVQSSNPVKVFMHVYVAQ